MGEPAYVAIDLKSFYASVECVERGLDPLDANLVVADESRTEKTICLAVSPPLKARGVPGRPRLFEVVQKVGEINALRRRRAPGGKLAEESASDRALRADPALAVGYLTAPPRMALYMDYSARIYQIYTRFIAPEDIHVYSIDEVFMDVTHYLRTYACTPRQLAQRMVKAVFEETGITATAGIGTNLYLAKVAMDIMAKRAEPDENGARVAELTEMSYREQLWDHRPITDFWRVGPGIARRLASRDMFTMGDVARCSHVNEEVLYRMFGVNAELLIDHAWGWESCTMADIKAFKPQSNSVGAGQVLHCPYDFQKARVVVREMADALALDLVEKGLVTDQLALAVGYDIESARQGGCGPVETDYYGRTVPKPAHGSMRLGGLTSSSRKIAEAMMELFDRVANPALLIRRLNVAAARVLREEDALQCASFRQLDMFTDYAAEDAARQREKRRQQAVIDIKRKFGKNAILMGMNLQDGATARDRNRQIGGHKA